MRKLTHYELRVLIHNEIYNLSIHESKSGVDDIPYIKSRAKEILEYCDEYESLEDTK